MISKNKINIFHISILLVVFALFALSDEMAVVKNIQYKTVKGVDSNLLSMDIYAPANARKLPVMVMIHGGAWSIGDKANRGVIKPKAEYFVSQGYLFVSINYRLSPDVLQPAHVQDVAAALRYVQKKIRKYGGDKKKIFVMGHSAGAHLAALVSVDDKYLKAEGASLKLIKGTILLDGAGYDIPRKRNQLIGIGASAKPYKRAFGNDPEVWEAASPHHQIKSGKSVSPFLIFYTGSKILRGGINNDFAAKLEANGYDAEVHHAKDKNHAEMNSHVGVADDWATKEIMEFLAGFEKK